MYSLMQHTFIFGVLLNQKNVFYEHNNQAEFDTGVFTNFICRVDYFCHLVKSLTRLETLTHVSYTQIKCHCSRLKEGKVFPESIQGVPRAKMESGTFAVKLSWEENYSETEKNSA